MAQFERVVTALDGITEGRWWNQRTWMVGKRNVAWVRPLSKADLRRWTDGAPPAGDIIAVRMENLDGKDAVLAMNLPGVFTIDHFRGYPAVLVALRQARARDLKRLLSAAWEAATHA